MVSLADLATEQQNNPNNPWLQDLTPGEQADVSTQLAAYNDPSGNVPGIGGQSAPQTPQTPQTPSNVSYAPVPGGPNDYGFFGSLPGMQTGRDLGTKLGNYLGSNVPTTKAPLYPDGTIPASTPENNSVEQSPQEQAAMNVPGAKPLVKAPDSPEMEYAKGIAGINETKNFQIANQAEAEARLAKIRSETSGTVADLTHNLSQQQKADSDAEKAEAIQNKNDFDSYISNKKIEADQIAKDAQKVGPDAYYKKKGTALNILSAIGVGLGAFGAGITHNRNYALDILEKSIDRDVDSQKEHIKARWDALTKDTSMHNDKIAYQKYEDQQVRDAKNLAYQSTTNLINETISRGTSKEAIENGKILTSQLLQKQSENDIQTKLAMRDARRYDQNVARAGAAQSPDHQYNEYAKEALKANSGKKLEDQTGVMSYKDWYNSIYRGGGVKSGGAVDKTKSVDELEKTGIKAADNNTVANFALSFLPSAMAPGANKAEFDADQWNNNRLPSIQRMIGDRVPPEMIQKAIESAKIHPGESRDMSEYKVHQFADWVRQALATPPRGKGTSPSEVEGAERMGE